MEFQSANRSNFWPTSDTQTAPRSKVQVRESMSEKKEQAMAITRNAADSRRILTAAFGHKSCGAKTSKTWRGR